MQETNVENQKQHLTMQDVVDKAVAEQVSPSKIAELNERIEAQQVELREAVQRMSDALLQSTGEHQQRHSELQEAMTGATLKPDSTEVPDSLKLALSQDVENLRESFKCAVEQVELQAVLRGASGQGPLVTQNVALTDSIEELRLQDQKTCVFIFGIISSNLSLESPSLLLSLSLSLALSLSLSLSLVCVLILPGDHLLALDFARV